MFEGFNKKTIYRLIQAAKLDPRLYKTVAKNEKLNYEAILIVILVAIIQGIFIYFDSRGSNTVIPVLAIIINGVLFVFSYYVFSWLTYFLGQKIFTSDTSLESVKRSIAYSYSPHFLVLLSLVPVLRSVLSTIIGFWVLITAVIAVMESVKITPIKAVFLTTINLIISGILFIIINGSLQQIFLLRA